ncbi:MAG: HPr family phosphocarrier protein [Clostridiales bacterium]|nr:HPr family phosphocarrier protein [Clostridiales bacterium]
MIEKEFIIEEGIGLHAQAAARFTKIANSYSSEIRIIKGNKTGNGKSLLSILALGIFGGTKFTVKIVGSDETEAMYNLTLLLEEGLQKS